MKNVVSEVLKLFQYILTRIVVQNLPNPSKSVPVMKTKHRYSYDCMRIHDVYIQFKMIWTGGMIKYYLWGTFIQWWIIDRFLHWHDHVSYTYTYMLQFAVSCSYTQMFLKTQNYVDMKTCYLLFNISFADKQYYSVHRNDISFYLK